MCLAVITGKASVYRTWSGQGSAHGGGAQPMQEYITDLGPYGQTLTDATDTVIWPATVRWRCEQGVLGLHNSTGRWDPRSLL